MTNVSNGTIPKRLLLAGATGLVGSHVLQLAQSDSRVLDVVAMTRQSLPSVPKLDNRVVDFDNPDESSDAWKVDGVICALGTTKKKARSQEAFRKVDFELPLKIAGIARSHGVPAFALNSALGADPDSRFFYSRVKGELEAALQTMGFPSLAFVRPGLLGGDRKESRPGERFARIALTALDSLLPKRFRICPAKAVAAALLDLALAARPGLTVVEAEKLSGLS